jgi:hypothetical protein
MAKYLSIIDSAGRATIEEQDDTAVWFTHARMAGRTSPFFFAVTPSTMCS